MKSYAMLDIVLSIMNQAYIESTTPYVDDTGTQRLPPFTARFLKEGHIITMLAMRGFELEAWNLSLMMSYLLKKEMIVTSDGRAIPGAWDQQFTITWEGRVLIEEGGYTMLHNSDKRKKRIEKWKEVLIIVGTLLGGIGAVGVLVLSH